MKSHTLSGKCAGLGQSYLLSIVYYILYNIYDIILCIMFYIIYYIWCIIYWIILYIIILYTLCIIHYLVSTINDILSSLYSVLSIVYYLLNIIHHLLCISHYMNGHSQIIPSGCLSINEMIILMAHLVGDKTGLLGGGLLFGRSACLMMFQIQ